MAEQMNSANLLQLIRETTPGVFDNNGERLIMTSLKGDFAPEEAWASFRPSGWNEDAWHAMERTHRVWSGTLRWDFKQAATFLRMLCGAPISDVTAGGKRTRVYAMPETGARNLDGSTFTLEYGQPGACDRCTYGLLMSISLPAERTGDSTEGNITIICKRPEAENVPMTGVGLGSEVQRITFANTPIDQFLRLQAEGGSATFDFKADVTTAALKAGIEALPEMTGVTVTVVDNRSISTDAATGESVRSGNLQLTFSGNSNVPQINVLSGEVQRLVVTNGDAGQYKLNNGANFAMGATAATLQTNQRALAGNYAAVVVKGQSAVGTATYVVSGAGGTDWNGTYLPDGANAYKLDSTHYLYLNNMGDSWYLGATKGGISAKYLTGPTGVGPTTSESNWVTDGSGTAPAPTVTLGNTGNAANFRSYFPIAAGNVVDPTATGTGAVPSTVQTGLLAAAAAVGSTMAQGTSGLVVPARVPMLNRNFSIRRAVQLALLDAAAPLQKAMMTSFDIGALVDPVWFFDENQDTYSSHVDGADPTKTLSIRLAKSSSDLAAMQSDARYQPARAKWYQMRAVHADDSNYSFRAEFFASPTGGAELGAGGNVRYVAFPLATVIEGGGTAARFTITEPA